MTKIVHIITRFINGGADENTLVTCNKFAEQGDEVWLIYGGIYSNEILSKLSPRVHAIRIMSLQREVSLVSDFKALVAISRLIYKINPDIVHTHTSKAGILGRLACLIKPSTYIIHGVHIIPFANETPVNHKLFLWAEKLAAIWTDAFINVSESMQEICLKYKIGRPENHFVIESGMDVNSFRAAKPATDIQAIKKQHPKAIVINYLAALEPRKQHVLLIRRMENILKKNPHIHLVFAGQGVEYKNIAKEIKSLKLEKNIHILGYRSDPWAVISASDICIYASKKEGLPRAVIQNVISGKPVVATKLPGIQQVVKDGINGYLVPPEDVLILAKKAAYLANDSELRRKMSRNSEKVDYSKWDENTMISSIQKVYEQIATPSS